MYSEREEVIFALRSEKVGGLAEGGDFFRTKAKGRRDDLFDEGVKGRRSKDQV